MYIYVMFSNSIQKAQQKSKALKHRYLIEGNRSVERSSTLSIVRNRN